MSKKLFYLSAIAVFALDRLTKILLENQHFTLIPGILRVNGTRNAGMAFGLLSGKTLLLCIVAVVLLCGMLWYVHKHSRHPLELLGLGLMAGGAVGNLVDRVLYGYVIDMLEPLFMNLFIFNVADAGITIGAVLLGAAILFGKEDTNDANA